MTYLSVKLEREYNYSTQMKLAKHIQVEFCNKIPYLRNLVAAITHLNRYLHKEINQKAQTSVGGDRGCCLDAMPGPRSQILQRPSNVTKPKCAESLNAILKTE